jgi:hypothetical protein
MLGVFAEFETTFAMSASLRALRKPKPKASIMAGWLRSLEISRV